MSAAKFLAGFGTGYMNAHRQKKDDERRDKKDKADEEDRALRREETNMRLNEQRQAATDRQTLRDAGADREALPGTAVTTGAGDKNLYADPAQAQAAAEEARIEAEMRGTDPAAVSTQAATGVTGKMATGHKISTEPVDVAGMNTPEAKGKRVIAALSGIDPLKAMDAQNTVTQRERETTKFTQDQTAYAKKLNDEGVFDALKAMRSGNGAGVAEAFNRSGSHKIVGEVTMTPEVREMPGLGKITTHTASFNVQMPDGTTKAMKYNSHDLGMSLMPYEKNLEVLLKGTESENRSELNAAKLALQTARASGGTGSGGGRGGSGAGDGAMPSFDPMAGFDSKNAQSEATKLVDQEISGSATPISPAQRADMIAKKVFALQDSYGAENTQRARVSIFKAEARKAKTPEEVQAVRERAAASGYTPEEMAALDPRFAARAPAAQQAPAPAAAAGTGTAPAAAAPPAAVPAAAKPAAPSVSPMAAAFGMTAEGGSMNAALAVNLPRAEAAAAAIQRAKANLAAAAKSQDPKALAMYARELQAARAGIDALTKDMQPAQMSSVRAAAGY